MKELNTYHIVLFICLYYVLLYVCVYLYDNHRENIGRWLLVAWLCIKRLSIHAVIKMMQVYKNIQSWLTKGESFVTIFKTLCRIGIFCWLVWTFENCWYGWYCEHVASYLKISGVFAYLLLTIYCLLLIISSILYGMFKRPLRKKAMWYLLFAVLVIYIRYRFCTDYFEFTTLSYIKTSIAYIDVIVAAFVIYFVVLMRYEKHRRRFIDAMSTHGESFYYYDGPISRGSDMLGFELPAQRLVEKLGTLTREHSWSIGVIGRWGSGKTSYINLVKNILPKDRYLVVSFNPRLASKPSKIQELALNELAEAVKPYNSGVRHLMRRYISVLQLDGTSGWVQVALSWFKSTYGFEDVKQELNKQLEKLPKQVVFIFDDFDRLTKDEIIEVLKLIDGIANFRNIIYIAAYDREQVGKLLESPVYIQKYFSVEVHVPIPLQDDIIAYMKQQIEEMMPSTITTDTLKMTGANALIQHQDLFKDIIHTLRDAKQYLNILKMDLQMIMADDIDNEDFILLTLLKYHNIQLYESICGFPSKYMSFDDKTVLFKHEEQRDLDSLTQRILSLLFPSEGSKGNMFRKIRNMENFYSYFENVDSGGELVSPIDVFDLTLQESDVYQKIVELCCSEGYRLKFFGYLEKYGKMYMNTKDSMLRLLDVVLYTNTLIGDVYPVPLINRIFLTSFYFPATKHKKYGPLYRVASSYVAQYFEKAEKWTGGDVMSLYEIVSDMYRETTSRNKYIVPKKIMEPIVRKRCELMGDEYLRTKSKSDFDKLMKVLYICVESIDPETHVITLDKASCAKLKSVINRAPTAYLKSFVRLALDNNVKDYNEVTCEPFWKQIFGVPRDLRLIIFDQKNNSILGIERVRNFWRLYKANNYEPISFHNQGDVQAMIDNDFKDQIKELDKLNALKRQLKSAYTQTHPLERGAIIKQILLDLETIQLSVALRDEIYNECQNYIKVNGDVG